MSNGSQLRKHAWPYSCEDGPAVGKVCSLYYSSLSDSKRTSVEAQEEYKPASRVTDVWQGASMLPLPSCALQLRSVTNYPTDRRKANLRLAELAICGMLAFRDLGVKHPKVPECGAGKDQVCELVISVPASSSDELQEPYIAAAIALAAYSKVCALFVPGQEYQCEVHRGDWAVVAGLRHTGGDVQLTGLSSPGLLQLKLDDAYGLYLKKVVLASESKPVYEETEFYRDDKLNWPHTPPDISFCGDMQCLVQKHIR